MRFFRAAARPTAAQLAEVDGRTDVLTVEGDGHYIVVADDGDKLPAWLRGADVVNVPSEPARCRNCGEPI